MKRLLIAAAFAAAATLTFASSAFAWKPYTHVQSGLTARADAVDDGKVTVAGKSYPVDSRVVDALRDWPSYYNAGVVGPDGFPDLTMGQSIIHPGADGRVAPLHPRPGLGRAERRELQREREGANPRRRVRLPHDNSRKTPRTFEIHATTASLLANLQRVNSDGKISDPKVYAGLLD